MPLSPPAPREHLHDRDIHCKGYAREDGLWDIEGHITDTKAYDFESDWRGEMKAGRPVHQMWVRLTIDDDMLIHTAEAVTDDGPFPICPNAAPNFDVLAGIRIGPGWTRPDGHGRLPDPCRQEPDQSRPGHQGNLEEELALAPREQLLRLRRRPRGRREDVAGAIYRARKGGRLTRDRPLAHYPSPGAFSASERAWTGPASSSARAA